MSYITVHGGTWWQKWERLNAGESNGKLPLKTCSGWSVSEPYQSPDWVLVPAKPAQGLNTHYYCSWGSPTAGLLATC